MPRLRKTHRASVGDLRKYGGAFKRWNFGGDRGISARERAAFCTCFRACVRWIVCARAKIRADVGRGDRARRPCSRAWNRNSALAMGAVRASRRTRGARYRTYGALARYNGRTKRR